MKVIFDRSAFHGDRFDLLKGSRLSQSVQERKILICHTAVFLEETFRMIDSPKQTTKDELRRQWPYLLSICNGGWFRPLLFGQPPRINSVCDEELASDERRMFDEVLQTHYKGSNTDDSWLLIPTSIRRNAEAMLTNRIEQGEPSAELDSWRSEWDENEKLKKENKALLSELRNRHTAQEGETFAEYFQSFDTDEAARRLIHRIGLVQPHAKFDAWRRDPKKFPHFAAYLEASIYSLYDADKNQNTKIDPNWQPDAEQLCFLLDVDAIISSDRGFMKRAGIHKVYTALRHS